MSEDKVTIVPNDLGAKIRVSSNNPEYAHVLLRQHKTIISTNGWVKSSTVHALLHGKVEDIQDIGIANIDTLPGQIVVKESLTPFNTENPDTDYKIAGNSGVVCCKHGEAIYRKCFYDPTMLEIDELISHTNGEDIRIAIAGDGKAEESFINKYIPSNQIDLEDSIAEVEAEEKETPHEYEKENTIGVSVEEKEITETVESDPLEAMAEGILSEKNVFDDTDEVTVDDLDTEDEDFDVEDEVEVEVEQDESKFEL